jgi:hypothetical protein
MGSFRPIGRAVGGDFALKSRLEAAIGPIAG